MKKLISVIMPAFQIEKHKELFLGSINSIISQTYSNWELLIVCDGNFPITINGIAKIINKYKDERIKLFVSKKQRGPGITRNIAFNYIKGDYVIFHDTDDFSQPDRFEKLINNIGDDGIIASNVIVNRMRVELGIPIVEKRLVKYSGIALDKLINYKKVRVPIHLPSAMITKELFKFMGGFEKYKYSSDAIFAIKLSYWREFNKQGPIKVIDEPLFNWNRHINSITMSGENAYIFGKCQSAQRKPLIKIFREQYINNKIKTNKDLKKYLGIVNNINKEDKLHKINIKYK